MDRELKKNAEQFEGMFSRQAVITEMRAADDNGKETSFRNVLATEQPVIVFDWYRWEPVREVLLMSGVELPKSRQVVLLDAHSRYAISTIKGSTRNVEVVDKQLEGDTYISSTAEKERILVEEKHLTDTSIGYETYNEHSVYLAPGEETIIDGEKFRNDYNDGYGMAIRKRWTLRENSLVPIGADDLAKFRALYSDRENQNSKPIQIDPSKPFEEQLANIKEFANKRISITENQKEQEMPPKEKTAEELQREQNEAVENKLTAELERRNGIDAVVRDFKEKLPGVDLGKIGEEYKKNRERSVMDFQSKVLELLKDPEAIRTADTEVGMSKKETQDYSIRKIILHQLGKLSADDVGLELEAHRTLTKKLGIAKPEGILIPEEIQRRRRTINLRHLSSNEKRDLLAGTPASGGYTVHDQYIPQSFIELLQNSMVFFRAGVDMITGLVGDIPMTRELDNYTYYHVGEGSGITKSSITFGQETMTPKKAGALGKYSYEWLLQTSLAAEAYIEKRLAQACALGLDYDIGYGTGSSYQPTGIKNWTGVGSVAGASFSRAKALEMEGQIGTANALDIGTQKFLSRPATRSILKGREESANTAKYLVHDDNTMIGYDYSNVSNQFAAGDLFFGVFSQVLVGYWDQLSIKASEYDDDAFKAGDVLVRALQAADVFLLNPGALSVAEGVN